MSIPFILQNLGTVSFLFSNVASQQTFLTGWANCVTANAGPALNTNLDAASITRYTNCATIMKVSDPPSLRMSEKA